VHQDQTEAPLIEELQDFLVVMGVTDALRNWVEQQLVQLKVEAAGMIAIYELLS
jgi:hypothetical protein